jgi:uncharacterized membrane protein YkvA (DUF1232 family)
MTTDMTGARRAEPLRQLGATLARLPRYLNLAQALVRDPAISRQRKAALGAGLIYTVSPIDLVPGIIPVVGQLDDLTALLLGIRTALHGCPPAEANRHLARVGLSSAALDEDLATVRRVALWLATQGARLIARTLTGAFRLISQLGRRQLRGDGGDLGGPGGVVHPPTGPAGSA